MAGIEAYRAGGPGAGYTVGGKSFTSSALAQSYLRKISGASALGQTVAQTASRLPTFRGGGTTGGVDPATMSALEKATAYYSPEGGFGKGTEAALERGRVKAVAGGMQGLVSAGLAGTTMMGGLGKKYEEEVAAPTRARVEETRAERISGLEVLKAQIIQGATEAARSRALQTYLARLGASTQMGIASMRGVSSAARIPTQAPTRDFSGADDYRRKPRESFGSIVGGREGPSPADLAWQQTQREAETWGTTGNWAGNTPLQQATNRMYQRTYA